MSFVGESSERAHPFDFPMFWSFLQDSMRLPLTHDYLHFHNLCLFVMYSLPSPQVLAEVKEWKHRPTNVRSRGFLPEAPGGYFPFGQPSSVRIIFSNLSQLGQQSPKWVET